MIKNIKDITKKKYQKEVEIKMVITQAQPISIGKHPFETVISIQRV